MKLYLLLFSVFLIGCLGPVTELYPEDEEQRPIDIYVISHGWHVGVAIEAAHISEALPTHEEMPDAEFLKFGWGDDLYYPEEESNFGLLLRAAVLPTRSVIHVVGIDIPLDRYFTGSDIIKIRITEQGAEKFAEFISDRFRRTQDGSILHAAPGRYGNSAFFEANGLYYIPKTSNTWTARALRRTGYPITPLYAVTSGNVIRQAQKYGEVIRLR